MRFYSMIGKGVRGAALARLSQGAKDFEIWDRVKSLTDADQWQTLDYNLDAGELMDYPPTNVLGRICSPRMVAVLTPFATDVLWLPVRLKRGDEVFDYRFMHFRRRPDVLDEPKSLIVNGKVVKPCISIAKAADVPMVCFYPLGLSILVRADVRDALLAAKLTKFEFQEVATSV